MPGYYKKGNRYIVTMITGPAHVYLGLKFGSEEPNSIKVIKTGSTDVRLNGSLDEEEIIKHSLEGVATANGKLNGELEIVELEYVANDSPRYDIYRRCAFLIAEAVLSGASFDEIA
ncbi:hypothetical protein KCM76_23715 [Zooshikella marina]|uniref:hypothetical protein n=1 Tax=Zooshikella ganghwensis TaxID=202772 RepID=UPI001BB004AD|nr:hypothetical protein [Zooshikella ganghwensis]MBU2709024.1 hypothetical protein [Zooshikella ganghwensis]